MSLPTWDIMKCECGGNQFLEVKRLRIHPTQGISYEPAGVKCEGCGLTADMAYMTRRFAIEQKKRELASAQEELKEIQGTEEPVNATRPTGEIPGKDNKKRREDQIGFPQGNQEGH